MKRVLIVSTGNSCRSQMAEALWNHLGQGRWQADSAGSSPAPDVHPLAIRAMKESGFDLSQARTKHLQDFQGQPFDLVVTVCDNARQSCPVFPGAKQLLHWPFTDPAHAEGTIDEKMSIFRQVREEIRSRIATYFELRRFLILPCERLQTYRSGQSGKKPSAPNSSLNGRNISDGALGLSGLWA